MSRIFVKNKLDGRKVSGDSVVNGPTKNTYLKNIPIWANNKLSREKFNIYFVFISDIVGITNRFPLILDKK